MPETSSARTQQEAPRRDRTSIAARAWRGATVGVALAAVIVSTLAGALFKSGLGTAIDALVGALIGALAVLFFGGVTLGVANVAQALPRYFLAALGGAIGAIITAQNVNLGWPDDGFYLTLLAFVWLQAFLAGALWIAVSGGLRHETRGVQVTTIGLLLIAVAVDVAGILWLAHPGAEPEPVLAAPSARSRTALKADNPARPGSYSVRTLFYGSGTDARRPEYGSRVDLRTEPVDASLILPQWDGFTARVRKWYWGFGVKRLPINGRVWYPEGAGPFPLVMIVHGNHGMQEYSDPGYAYLGTLLASRGFIAVSVDENFINGSWSGDFRGDEIPARAWLLLQHLKQWRTWNRAGATPFHQKVNMEKIGLLGHSRGGEAAPLAARFNELPYYPDNAKLRFDFGFSIESVVALAPTDYRYSRRVTLRDVNYLTLQGSYDSDERSFFGIRQYQRVALSDSLDYFKAGLYIHRANHGQFNSVWGRTDAGPPWSWFLNTGPIIAGEAQRQIARVYVTAFMEATLRDQQAYIPLFRDHHAASAWLPETTYLHRFQGSDYRTIANYEEDIDVTTSTAAQGHVKAQNLSTWQEHELPFRGERTQHNNAVYLGWDYVATETAAEDATARYSVVFPEGYSLPASPEKCRLAFSLARLKSAEARSDPPSSPGTSSLMSVTLVGEDGKSASRPLSELVPPPPPVLETRYLKLEELSKEVYGQTWEPTLQTYSIGLSDFASDTSFAPSALQAIHFTFDQSPQGKIALDDIGIEAAR